MTFIDVPEKDIENFLCKNGGENLRLHLGLRLISSQYRTRVGIIDILAYDEKSKRYAIIELKKDLLDYKSYFQAERYKWFMTRYKIGKRERREFFSVLVGRNLSPDLNYSVEYLDRAFPFYGETYYVLFDISLEGGISFNYYSKKQREIEIEGV